MPITYQILHWVLCISCVSPHTRNLPLPWSSLLYVCACVCTPMLVVVCVLRRSNVHTLSVFISPFQIIIFDIPKAVHDKCIQLGKPGNKGIHME